MGGTEINLKYMKRWYSFYYQHVAIRQRPVDELEMPMYFGRIPWGQHIENFKEARLLLGL